MKQKDTNRVSIAWTEECWQCKASGLQVTIRETDGAAIVCTECGGSGKIEHSLEYRPFTGRRTRPEVKRVFATNPGYESINAATPGGVTLEQWQEDPSSVLSAGAETRTITCPLWWAQATNPGKSPKWPECIRKGAFFQCPSFPKKHLCWERWDQESENKRSASSL